jgi:hypothetical protein
MGTRSTTAAFVYVPQDATGGRNVSAAFVYAVVVQQHIRHTTAGLVYAVQDGEAARNVTSGFVYVVITPPEPAQGMLVYNGIILDAWLDAFSMDAIAKAIDVSNFASEGARNMTGLPSWTMEIGGPWDTELDDILGIDAVRSLDELRSAWLRLEGIRYEWIPTIADADRGAILSNYQVISSPNDAIRWTATLTCSRSPVRINEIPIPEEPEELPELVSVPLASSLDAKAYNLWNGFSNVAPPTNWQTLSYDDSTWPASVESAFPPPLTGTIAVRRGTGTAAVGAQQLIRQHFTLARIGDTVTLDMRIEDQLNDVYVNGVRVGGDILADALGAAYNELSASIDPAILVIGDNVIAARYKNGDGTAIGLSYKLTQA